MIGSAQLGRVSRTPQEVGSWAREVDTAPSILPAGKVTKIEDEGAKKCVQQDTYVERPTTPTDIKKYRQSTVHQPGVIIKHYGLAEDAPPPGPYGVKTSTTDTVSSVIATYPTSELMQYNLECQEEIYASSKAQPLGTTAVRGHAIPGELGKDKPFGTFINALEKSLKPEAKGLVYPVDAALDGDDDPAVQAQYVRTHGDYAPGEQRRRGYDWASSGIDPEEDTFGTIEKFPYRNGVAKAVNPTIDDGAATGARIVSKVAEDFRMAETEQLGAVKSIGANGGKPTDPEHVFGLPSRRFDEWGVRRLVAGDYTEGEREPDCDLGKSLKQGFRNKAPGGREEGKIFGTPTIRTDIPGPKVKSVADNQNYGGEPGAATLLYPAAGAVKGVTDDDFLKQLTKDELADIVGAAGLDPSAFDEAFSHASAADGTPEMSCCVNTFQQVRLQMRLQSL